MITCRPVLRFDRVLRFTNRNFVSNLEWCDLNCTVKKMGGKKDFRTIVNPNKQQRTVSAVWRPVATQASAKEDLGKNVPFDTGNGRHTQDVECSLSGGISTAQHVGNDLMVESGDGMTYSMSGITSSAQPGVDKGEAANETRTSEGETGHSSKKHSVKLEVGASLFRFVKGKGGSTQKQIEEEMGVKIMIPSSKEEDYVLVEGFSIDSITKASEKIKDVIDEAVRSPNLDYSHFVSLPLAIHPELVDKLFNFQKSILRMDSSTEVENQESASDEDYADNEDKDQKTDKQLEIAVELKVQDDNKNVEVKMSEIQTVSYPPKVSKSSSVSDLGIDKSIFIKPKTFHLTVLMLKLWNKDRVKAATEVLQSISSKVMYALDNRPISIRLKGLDNMRGSLAKARVLYAPVEEIGNEDRLLRACQVIIDAYVEAGLVLEKDAKQKLKLHATVMNARHRKGKKRTRKVDSFDARGIFKQYGSEEWGEYLISEAHLSKRFVFDENGYYHCCSSIPFPKDTQEID